MLHQVGTASAPHNRSALNIFQPVTGCESAEQVTGVKKTEIISTEQEKHCCWEETEKPLLRHLHVINMTSRSSRAIRMSVK